MARFSVRLKNGVSVKSRVTAMGPRSGRSWLHLLLLPASVSAQGTTAGAQAA